MVLNQTPHSFIALLWTCSSASMSFLLRGAQNWTQYSRCSLTSAEYWGTITSLLLLAALFLIQARMSLAFLSTCAHCRLMFSQVSTNTPKSVFFQYKENYKLLNGIFRHLYFAFIIFTELLINCLTSDIYLVVVLLYIKKKCYINIIYYPRHLKQIRKMKVPIYFC